MARRTSAAVIAALLVAIGPAGGAMAQSSGTPAPATPPASDAPASDAPAAPAAQGQQPAEATPAPAEGEGPKVGQTYTKSTHGDWTLRCMKTQDGKDPCELYQLLKDANGASVAEASVLPMTGKVQAIVTFIAPLETDLQQGLSLQIDNGKEARFPFLVCAPVGCVSRIGLTDADLAPMKKGKAATVTLHPFGAPADQRVRLNLSLAGFTAGLDALIEANKDLPPPAAAPVPAPAPAAEANKPAPAADAAPPAKP